MECRTLGRVFNSCVAHLHRAKGRLDVHEDTLPGWGKAISVETSLELLLANLKFNTKNAASNTAVSSAYIVIFALKFRPYFKLVFGFVVGTKLHLGQVNIP